MIAFSERTSKNGIIFWRDNIKIMLLLVKTPFTLMWLKTIQSQKLLGDFKAKLTTMTQEAWQLLLSLRVDWQGEKNEEVEEEAGLLWIRTTSVMVGGKG